MPKQTSRKRARSKASPIKDLPVKSLKAGQAKSVTGGGRTKAADPTPSENVSFSFAKVNLEYGR